MPSLAQNKKAYHSYSIEDTFEAGIVLLGPEVKSIKNGQASLAGAFVSILGGEAYLRNAYIAKYKQASGQDNYNESRDRKLLLHKKEILKLVTGLNEKGTTLIPLEIYTKKNRIKVKVGLAKGKKQYDKRASIKKKEIKRSIERTVRSKV